VRTVCGDGMCIVLGSACAFSFDATFFFTYQDGEDYANVGSLSTCKVTGGVCAVFFLI